MPKYLVMFYRIYQVEEDNPEEAEEQAKKPFEEDLETMLRAGSTVSEMVELFRSSIKDAKELKEG